MVTFDHPDKSANILSEAALDELNLALDAVISFKPRGIIFTSAKPSVFIAGADLNSFLDASGPEIDRLVEKGQRVFSRISELPFPAVAAIHGACLGGGLELALACDSRVASSDDVTRMGLPETTLGILPAWGGSTRLPRLIGLPKALKLILSGRPLSSSAAWKVGLVDVVVPKERLNETAGWLIAGYGRKHEAHRTTNNRISSTFLRRIARHRVLNRTRGNYPAQLAAIDVVTRAVRGGFSKSLLREKEAVMKLAGSLEAKNLMRVFRLQEEARKSRYDVTIELESLPKLESAAVIGAGVMGAGIAQWFSSRDVPVILQDIDREKVSQGMASVNKLFDAAVKRRIFSPHEASQKRDLISPVARAVPLAGCDLVVEAAVEDLSVKKKIFAELSRRSSAKTILATNTSALPISELCTAPGVTHPERIVGLHFFNPVSRMKLVEVVVTDLTSHEVVEQVLMFVRRIGKVPVVVKDSPGFLVNRILMPYLIGAGRLVEFGCSPEEIDDAMLNFGMPMGPLRLLDEIGLDVAAHVAATMEGALGERFEAPPGIGRLVASGHLGRKTGRGFYQYEDGKAVGAGERSAENEPMSGSVIAGQLASLMAEEAHRCLEEGVVKSSDEVDLAMILGIGFAPFRGGPLRDEASREEP